MLKSTFFGWLPLLGHSFNIHCISWLCDNDSPYKKLLHSIIAEIINQVSLNIIKYYLSQWMFSQEKRVKTIMGKGESIAGEAEV